MRQVRVGLWLMALGIILFCVAQEVRAEEGVKGVYVTYNSSKGNFAFEPFLKTGDKEYDSEDGQAEIWGYKPWSEAAKKNGQPIKVNVPAARFVPCDRKSHEVDAGTLKRMIRCPEGFW